MKKLMTVLLAFVMLFSLPAAESGSAAGSERKKADPEKAEELFLQSCTECRCRVLPSLWNKMKRKLSEKGLKKEDFTGCFSGEYGIAMIRTAGRTDPVVFCKLRDDRMYRKILKLAPELAQRTENGVPAWVCPIPFTGSRIVFAPGKDLFALGTSPEAISELIRAQNGKTSSGNSMRNRSKK